MSNLLAVLETSAIAEATSGEMTVKIERTDDMNGAMMGYWYDIQRPGQRIHTFYFDYDIDVPGMEWDLQEMGIDTEGLVWQATDQGIDLRGCTCQDCQQFRVENGLPIGAHWSDVVLYRIRCFWSSLEWKLYLLRVQFREWRMRWYR